MDGRKSVFSIMGEGTAMIELGDVSAIFSTEAGDL